MAQRNPDADRLWAEMQALEKEQPGAQEDKKAFFTRKQRRMAELKAAYDKAAGVVSDPTNGDMNQRIGNQQLLRGIGGQPGSSTRDSLNG